MTTNAYDIGDVARISGAFTDIDGNPADPGAITLSIEDPDGEVAEVAYPGTIVKDSTGAYHYDVPLTLAGFWEYRWVGTGAVAAAAQGRLWVRASNVG